MTKAELLAEVKKLQRNLELVKKKKEASAPEILWQAAMKFSANMVVVVDKNYVIVDINKVKKGYSKKDILGKKAFDFSEKENKPTIKNAIDTVFKTRKPFEYITNANSKKGDIITLSCKATPVLDNKKVAAVIIEATDKTNEIETQKQLTRSEEKFRMLAQNAVDIIYRYKLFPTFECEFISPSVKKITGYSPEEFYKDPVLGLKIIHPDDFKIAEENNVKMAKSKPGQIFQPVAFRNIRKDKKVICVETLNLPVFNDKGKLIAIEGITRDITERKKSEEIIRQSQEDLTQVLNNINELVYYIEFLPDGKKRIKYLSSQITKILDVTPEEYANEGDNLLKLCHPDDIEKIKEIARGLRRTLKPEEYVYRFYHRTKKEYIWIEERITPQINKEGKYIGNFGLVRDVTEKINAQTQLHESEEKFRMLAENALDVVYRFRLIPNAKYEYVSPSIVNLSGYTAEEFYADPNLGFKIIHPEDNYMLGDSEKLIFEKKVVRDVKDKNIKVRWIKKDGSVIWTETVNTPIRDKEGRVVAIEGISRDITQQKESEERFKILSNATFEGIVFSEHGKIIDANDQFLKMYGYSSVSEILGKHVIDDFVIEKQRAMARKFLRLPKSEPYEVETVKKDGTRIIVETKAQNIPYFGKTIRATVIYNITDRKQYEHSLRESERTLSTLMGNLPGMAYRCLFDENWTMEFVNQGCLELTGYRPADLIQNKKISYNELILPEDRRKVKELVKKAVENKRPYVLSYKIKTAGNETKWVWEKGEGVFSEKGKLLFLEGFIIDATERQKFEVELKRSRENYKSLVDYSPDGVFIHIDGKVVFANPSAMELVGVKSMDEALGFSLFDFLLPEFVDKIKERVEKTIGGEPQDFIEIKIKTRTGETKEVETKPILIKFNGQNAVLTVVHDISTQKQLVKEQLRAHIAEETNELLEQEITKRKVIQLQLQESQKYTRLLIDSSLDMICASDREGFITEFNRAAQQTFGYKDTEVIGKHVSMLYAVAEQRSRITDEELYKKGVYSGEVFNVRKNGEGFVAFLSASVLKNEAGEIVGAMGVSRDISELKKAEQELRNSEEKYRAIYNQAFIGIARVGLKDGNFIEVNQRLCQMLGYTSEELCGMTTSGISHPDDFLTNQPERLAFLESGSNVLSTEKRYIKKNGGLVYANLTITLVKDGNGVPQYFIYVYEDITERKQAEEKIKAQSAKLNAVFESSSHLIWTLDINFCLTSFNQNFFRFFRKNYNLDIYIGLNMVSDEVKTTDEYNDLWKQKYRAVLKGESQHFETKLINVWREVFLNPIFDENGVVREISGIANDITEKKYGEEKIRQSLQEKEVLLKEVHHRVKNNLQVISSILNLQSSYVKDTATLNILKESQNRIKSMAFIHESLYQTKDFSSINFSEYVVNLAHNLIQSYSNFDNEIKLNLDIQNVFLNLDLAIPCGLIINEIVSNALKYAFVDKKYDCEVTVSMSLDDENLILIVGDNGIGLPKEIDYRNTQSLGLQLVVTLTDQLNGTIKMESEKGTKYTIIFKQNQVKNRI
jgi:PAS domain S-box-containing protein